MVHLIEHDSFPLTLHCVVRHKNLNSSEFFKQILVHTEGKGWLTVVTLEGALHRNFFGFSRELPVEGNCLLIDRRERGGRLSLNVDIDLLEDLVRSSIRINRVDLDLAVILVSESHSHLLPPLGDVVAELLHEQLHDIIALSVDAKSCILIQLSLLQVANDKVTAVSCTLKRHITGRGNSQRRSHSDTKIRHSTILETGVQDILVELLAKVDNGVNHVASAIRVVTLATSLVRMDFLGDSNSEITHVLFATLLADFKISISVDLTQAVRVNSTLSVETIDILRDYVLEVTSFHQLNETHMSQRGLGLGNLSLNASCGLLLSAFIQSIILLLICSCFPTSRTSRHDGVVTRTVIRDTTSGRNTSTCENGHVLGHNDHLGQH